MAAFVAGRSACSPTDFSGRVTSLLIRACASL